MKSKIPDALILQKYEELNSVWAVGTAVGLCGQSVHERLTKLGIKMEGSGRNWTEKENSELLSLYSSGFLSGDGKLEGFCKKHNRTKPFVSRMARKLGLSNIRRSGSEEYSKKTSERVKKWIKDNGHPRGALGTKVSPETLKKMADGSKKYWETMTEEKLTERRRKTTKTRESNGTLYQPRNASWKAAWRNIGGIDKYYRSRWEANYARYLQWLLENKKIANWQHEPETFWFDAVKRGCVSYLPDFKVTEIDGSISYHEVKGWMDDRSKTKIKRMKKYYPEINLIIIEKKQYQELVKKVSGLINGWE